MKNSFLFFRTTLSPQRILLAGMVLLGIFSLCFSFTDVTISGNDATRFAVIQAVGEQHVFHIENTEFRTVDLVRRDGHIYSDKPLFPAWSMGMLHRAVHAVTGWQFAENYALLIWFYNVLTGFVCNALIFWWLFNAFRRIRKGSVPVKGLLAFAGVCTTWILSYSVIFNNHTPAAVIVLGTYIMLEKFRQKPAAPLACGIGAAAGFLAVWDIPLGGLCCAAVCAAVWQMTPGKNIFYTAAGAGLLLFLSGLLNFWAYGVWTPLYMAGTTGTFHPVLNLSLGYWVEALFGWQGLFLYQPFLILGLIPRKKESAPDRWMYIFAIAGIVFYCTVTNEFGGASYGFRYLIPLIPVLYCRTVKWLLTVQIPAAGKTAAAAVLLLWGLASAVVGAYVPFGVGFEGYRTPEGHFCRTIRSSFGGNLLSACFEYAPDSRLTAALIRHYGLANAYRYLYESYFNIKRPDLIKRVQERVRELP